MTSSGPGTEHIHPVRRCLLDAIKVALPVVMCVRHKFQFQIGRKYVGARYCTYCAVPVTKPIQPQITAPTCHKYNHETISATECNGNGPTVMNVAHTVTDVDASTPYSSMLRFRSWNATRFVCLFLSVRSAPPAVNRLAVVMLPMVEKSNVNERMMRRR